MLVVNYHQNDSLRMQPKPLCIPVDDKRRERFQSSSPCHRLPPTGISRCPGLVPPPYLPNGRGLLPGEHLVVCSSIRTALYKKQLEDLRKQNVGHYPLRMLISLYITYFPVAPVTAVF